MKPLQLMMQAFGPYAEKEVIDFTKLENRTMFVISGKTGSGKTTIFDGISYAIYGKASGDDRDGSGLRSHFSEDVLATEVGLDFSLRNKQYYIWRAPQQEKKKARGDGYTMVGAKAEIYVVNDEGERELLAANVRDTDEKIREIIQLDANQFRQILMIPQGEFRKLLTSDSKEKEIILQRLFHTEFYKKIEERLKEEATELKKTVESQVENRTRLLRNVFHLENEALTVALEETHVNDTLVLELLAAEINIMNGKFTGLKQEYEKQKVARDAAKKDVHDAEELLGQFAQKAVLEKEKQTLEAKKDDVASQKKQIALAQKAAILEQQEVYCHHLKQALDTYEENLEKEMNVLAKAKLVLTASEQVYIAEEQKEQEREQLAREISQLENIKKDVHSFAERKSVLVQTEKDKLEVEERIKKGEAFIQVSTESLEQFGKESKEIDALKVKSLETERALDDRRRIKEQLTHLSDKVNACSVSERQVVEKTAYFTAVESRFEDAKRTLEAIENAWQTGQAAILAGKLVNGDACPVCGSDHHPALATSNQDIPTEADRKMAKAAVEKSEKEKSTAERTMLEAEVAHKQLALSVSELTEKVIADIPDFTLENLAPNVNKLDVDVRRLTLLLAEQLEACKKEAKITAEIEKNGKQLVDAKEKLATLKLSEQTLTNQFITEKVTVDRMNETIPESIRTVALFNQQLQTVQTKKATLERAFNEARQVFQKQKENVSAITATEKQLREDTEKAKQTLTKERTAFLGRMTEQGFSDYKVYEEAKRSEMEIAGLENAVQSYHEQIRSVTDRLQVITEKLHDVEVPDLQVLTEAFERIDQTLATLNEEQTKLHGHIERNAAIQNEVVTMNEEIKEAEETYLVIGHLSDVARGQNTARITFERFVLAAFLDDILRNANERLSKMTSGRYTLLRKTDRSKGNVQSGLELHIYDQYTSQERHVKTLSGGESFKASLALALGLADVVQQHAGGVSLETMFIDEGFGTLDPESLDNAIEALMDIQSSGRLVGIISHVPELKERIDARLEVISSQNGSRTEFIFMG